MGIAGCLLIGCSTQPMRERLQPIQEKLEPTERAVQPTASAIECGGGSVKASIESCKAQGGHYGHCALIASRAGVSSATSCYTYASKIHKRREQLVGQEDQLDAQIHYLQDVNKDTEALNAELSGRLEEVTARTDTAVESLAQGEMTRTELAQLRTIIDGEVSYAQRQLGEVTHELQSAEQYRLRQQPVAAALDAEIVRLQGLLADAQRQTNSLVAQRQRF